MNKVLKLERENNILSFMHCTNYKFPANNNVVFIQLLFDKLFFILLQNMQIEKLNGYFVKMKSALPKQSFRKAAILTKWPPKDKHTSNIGV